MIREKIGDAVSVTDQQPCFFPKAKWFRVLPKLVGEVLVFHFDEGSWLKILVFPAQISAVS